MIDLKSMTLEELTAFFKEMGQPAFRAKQVFRWLYRGVTSFEEMTDLSKGLREQLEAAACSGECPEFAGGRPGAEGGSAEAGEDVTDWTIHCQGRVRLAAWHVE